MNLKDHIKKMRKLDGKTSTWWFLKFLSNKKKRKQNDKN